MWNPLKKNSRVNSPAGDPESCGQGTNSDPRESNLDPKKAHVYNLIIVDESGSMSGLTKVTVSGINETIGTIKKAQEDFADTQQHFLTLVTFDERPNVPPIRTHMDAMPIGDVPDDFNDYQPHGCTPLLDAMGESLSTLYARVKDDENATGVVTVITDGLENSSRKWSGTMVRQLIEQLKELGWSFSYMGSTHDVKSVSMRLSIEHVLECEHNDMGTASSWHRDSSSKHAFFRRMSNQFIPNEALEMKRAKMRDNARAYFSDRVTPDYIDQLPENGVFVFGSNEQGTHSGGAAALAVERFGAVVGQAEGPQGQSYAIPTTGGISLFAQAVERFIDYAAAHPDQRFFVTRVGCGYAGYHPHMVARLFVDAIKQENICLPEEFWAILGLKMM